MKAGLKPSKFEFEILRWSGEELLIAKAEGGLGGARQAC